MKAQGLFTLCLVAVLAAFASSEEAELKIEKVKEVAECERRSKSGDQLTMHYTGTLEDGTKFDSSRDHEEPFVFQLGMGEVIKGWDQGLLDMCEGEQRKLTIPPSMGYGDKGAGDKIPAGATLLFDVELVKVEDGPPPTNVFKDIDTDKDNNLSVEEMKVFLKGYIAKEYPDQAELYSGEWGLKRAADFVFRDVDKNQDGVITLPEFLDRHLKAKQEEQENQAKRDEL